MINFTLFLVIIIVVVIILIWVACVKSQRSSRDKSSEGKWVPFISTPSIGWYTDDILQLYRPWFGKGYGSGYGEFLGAISFDHGRILEVNMPDDLIWYELYLLSYPFLKIIHVSSMVKQVLIGSGVRPTSLSEEKEWIGVDAGEYIPLVRTFGHRSWYETTRPKLISNREINLGPVSLKENKSPSSEPSEIYAGLLAYHQNLTKAAENLAPLTKIDIYPTSLSFQLYSAEVLLQAGDQLVFSYPLRFSYGIYSVIIFNNTEIKLNGELYQNTVYVASQDESLVLIEYIAGAAGPVTPIIYSIIKAEAPADPGD